MAARVFPIQADSGQFQVISYPIRRPVGYGTLTAAETQVAERLIEGASVRAIAVERGVSERTVNNQVACVYRKLEVSSRHELVKLAARPQDEK